MPDTTIATAVSPPPVEPSPAASLTEIVPTRKRMRVRSLPRQWPVIRVLAQRDFKVKYKQSLLGPLWLMIQPAALLAAFAVAFSGSSGSDTAPGPYALFVLVGLSVWTYFQAAMVAGTAAVVGNSHLVRRTSCPRFAFPMASLLASTPTLAVTGGATLVVALAAGRIGPRALLLPLLVIWLLVLTCAVVALLSAIAVRFRDIPSALPFVLQLGVFLSPIGYSFGHAGTAAQLLAINPLTGLMGAWRWSLMPGVATDAGAIGFAGVVTIVLVIAGWQAFSRLEVTMADDI